MLGNVGSGRMQGRNWLFPMSHEFFHDGLAAVHRLAGQQVIQRASQSIDVGTAICFPGVQGLFRSHEIDGSNDHSGGGQIGLQITFGFSLQASHTHVQNLDRSLLVQQQVGGLDIPMDDPLSMSRFETPGGLNDAFNRHFNIERPILLDGSGKVAAVHQFHDEEVNAAGAVGVMGGDDVGMTDPGRRFDLPLETRD